MKVALQSKFTEEQWNRLKNENSRKNVWYADTAAHERQVPTRNQPNNNTDESQGQSQDLSLGATINFNSLGSSSRPKSFSMPATQTRPTTENPLEIQRSIMMSIDDQQDNQSSLELTSQFNKPYKFKMKPSPGLVVTDV